MQSFYSKCSVDTQISRKNYNQLLHIRESVNYQNWFIASQFGQYNDTMKDIDGMNTDSLFIDDNSEDMTLDFKFYYSEIEDIAGRLLEDASCASKELHILPVCSSFSLHALVESSSRRFQSHLLLLPMFLIIIRYWCVKLACLPFVKTHREIRIGFRRGF
jgi:hypothetical protein